MKAILFALFVALLMVGCGEDAQKEDESDEKIGHVEEGRRLPLVKRFVKESLVLFLHCIRSTRAK